MTRSVVILGFCGVQALDLVGPFEVFTGATLRLAAQGAGDKGYDVTVASLHGEAVSTGSAPAHSAPPRRGCLDGCPATTHWAFAGQLAADHAAQLHIG